MCEPCQIVILGASGDLALRKLLPALVSVRDRTRGSFSVIGVARRPKSDDAFRAEVEAAIPPALRGSFAELAPCLFYVGADVQEEEGLGRLASRLDALPGAERRVFYLAVKPDLFGPSVERLAMRGLLRASGAGWSRVVIEKPFGHDLESARHLNARLREVLHEEQVFRIDHYLGKETVQNLLGLRFHNAIFEPIWNRHHVELVQITVAEDLGMERGRAAYYDSSGALRDMLQNHMLQLLALTALEPPSSLDPNEVRDRKVSVLRALRPLTVREARESTVRARYTAGVIGGKPVPGYLEEDGVPAGSSSESYVAVRAELASWRWSGVPFLLRHGKRLGRRFTEIQVHFRTAPLQLFNRPAGMTDEEFQRALRTGLLCQIRPNVLTLSIQPRETITLSFGVKRPGSTMEMAPASLKFDYREAFGDSAMAPYERLLLDVLAGDATLFLRADEIEACWEFTDSIRRAWDAPEGPPLLTYPAGTWGPAAADELFRGCEGGWSRGTTSG
jgi:glucose-6-phosphate 1-dehydrogenase